MKKYFSELLGTFILVFFGTGTAIMSGLNPDTSVGALGIAWAFGLSVIAAAYSIGHISGGHLNPAISFAMFLDRRLSGQDFALYSVFQTIGALLATALLYLIFSSLSSSNELVLGANSVGDLNIMTAFLVELVLTFVFVFVVLSVTKTKFIAPNLAVVIIGFTLTMVHLVGIPLTGTSVNPARSIAPAVFMGGAALSELWVFILAPMVGAAIAVLANNLLDSSEVHPEAK